MKDMKWIVLSSCLLFTMFIGHGRACEYGLFGSNCDKQCFCYRVNCTTLGECVSNPPCLDGWGGRSCSYRDEAFSKASPLTDNNNTTCLDSFSRRWYRFTMREETKLSWIRFNLKKQNVFDNATISFEDSSNETVVPTFLRKIVDGYTVDLFGRMNVTFKYIKIVFKFWESKQYFCGMFVSGGRNVAFKQPVNISSVWGNNVAALAVDGDVNPHQDNNHCASTQAQRGAWLNLRPRQPIDINFIEIYNRNVLQCRLKRFKMWLLSELSWGSTVQTHHDQLSEPQSVYKVFATYFGPIQVIYLEVDPSYWGPDESQSSCGDNSNENVLAVCELKVYGEVVCATGLYGYDCEEVCHSRCVSGCHVETGYCNRCAAGRSGRHCENIETTESPEPSPPISRCRG